MPSEIVRKSPTEQILEDTIKKIEKSDDFTEEIISALLQLKVKDFTKSQKILEVLKMEVPKDEAS